MQTCLTCGHSNPPQQTSCERCQGQLHKKQTPSPFVFATDALAAQESDIPTENESSQSLGSEHQRDQEFEPTTQPELPSVRAVQAQTSPWTATPDMSDTQIAPPSILREVLQSEESWEETSINPILTTDSSGSFSQSQSDAFSQQSQSDAFSQQSQSDAFSQQNQISHLTSSPKRPQPGQSNDPHIGMTLGNFCLLEKIGQGGFGAVYRAEQIHLQQPFAVKVLKLNLEANPEIVERFKREARALALLKHDGIVQLADFGLLGQERDGFYLAMEFLEGKSLKQAIKKGGSFQFHRILHIFRQICAVLQYVHRKGVCHRDLKPANILLVEDDFGKEKVKLIDFGIAAVSEEGQSITQEGTYLGSPLYMSPEQGRNGQIDHRSDLYALGVILYLLLVGRPPFSGESFPAILSQHLFKPPPHLEELAPQRKWSPQLNAFLHRVLAKEPEDRPQDARAFWAECQQAFAAQTQLEPDWAGNPGDEYPDPDSNSGSHGRPFDNFSSGQPSPFQVTSNSALLDDSLNLLELSTGNKNETPFDDLGHFLAGRQRRTIKRVGIVVIIVIIGLSGWFVTRITPPPKKTTQNKTRVLPQPSRKSPIHRPLKDPLPHTVARSVLPPDKKSSPQNPPKWLPVARKKSNLLAPPPLFSLQIKSIPSDAEVWLKGKKIGMTPFSLERKEKTSLVFVLRKEKYRHKAVRWRFRKGKYTRTYKLRPKKKKSLYDIAPPI